VTKHRCSAHILGVCGSSRSRSMRRSPAPCSKQVRNRLAAGGSWIRTFGPAVRGTAVGRAPAPDHRRLARAPALNDRHPGLSVRHLPSITPIDPFARAGPEVQIRLPPAGSLPRTRSSQRMSAGRSTSPMSGAAPADPGASDPRARPGRTVQHREADLALLGRSRRPHGQLCRDSCTTSHRL
jgi:hypothetical protein